MPSQSAFRQSPGRRPSPSPSAKSLQTDDTHPSQLSTIRQVAATEPAPTVNVYILSINGLCKTQALPDSGADISAAGPQLLQSLGEHTLNLLSLDITPQAANGHKMQPIGKLPITFQLQGRSHSEDTHIYPEISGFIMSWKAAKGLSILPVHYPDPIPVTVTTAMPAQPPAVDVKIVSATTHTQAQTNMVKAFPMLFDGQIRVMQGEEFHISLTANAKPFCVNTPRTIPFAYCDKLKAELDLLEFQHVIAPVTEATTWCAPIVVIPKKKSDKIRMCVDLSHLNRFVIRERYYPSSCQDLYSFGCPQKVSPVPP